MPKKIIIEILRCETPTSWYKKRVGGVFEVEEFTGPFSKENYLLRLDNKERYISKADCIQRLDIAKTERSNQLKDILHGEDLNYLEKQVLILAFNEFTSKEIGLKLNKSKRTIESRRQSMFMKLGVNSMIGAIKFGLKNDILKL